jgi:hypothetical protein
MKFSPTATLALVLAAGLTGAVSAQTTNARINPRAQSFAAEAQRYTDQVQEAQERLYAAGLYKGPADGHHGTGYPGRTHPLPGAERVTAHRNDRPADDGSADGRAADEYWLQSA